MKSKKEQRHGLRLLVAVNWALSLCAVGSLDLEHSEMYAVCFVFSWFLASSIPMIKASNRNSDSDQ